MTSLGLFLPLTLALAPGQVAPTPEGRALAYLAREVPRWSADNKCFSCHHNGDGARALYAAARHSYPVSAKALQDTTAWLMNPAGWDHNGGEGPFSDKKLARLQFAAALAEAVAAGHVKSREALRQAAARVAADQKKDGSWPADAEGTVGSPATYGTCLATHQARQVLRQADADKYREALERSDRWLRRVRVESVLDAAAVLLALAKVPDDAALAQRRRCLALIHKGQAERGGWGPFTHSPPEAFDTALVLLALAADPGAKENKAMLRKGRASLLALQRADGSWEETTRPAGGESYAQRLSTTAWATLALLHTADRRPTELSTPAGPP